MSSTRLALRACGALAVGALLASLLTAHTQITHAQPKRVGAPPTPATSEVHVTSLDQLLTRLAGLSGMRARYQEEKHIALLKRPLHSEGIIAFAAPNLLLRRAEKPEPSTLLLEGSVLRIADGSGTRRIDLQENSVVRHFVMTFLYVLSGDRASLDRLYTLAFQSTPSGGWQLVLTPKAPDLARIIKRATLLGRGFVVEQMTIEEPTGDSTVLRFLDVKLDQHYDEAERARLFRLPTK